MINEIELMVSKIKNSKPKQLIDCAQVCYGLNFPQIPFSGDLLRILEQLDSGNFEDKIEVENKNDDDVTIEGLNCYQE